TPQDVAMYSSTCRGDCGAATQTLYVTTDGGKTWALASSDDSGEAGAVFGWVGATLFANGAPAVTPHAAQQFLAKSTNGGPYSWTTLPAAPGQILTSGTTLYVVTGSQTSCAAPGFCSDLWTSPDLGATWSHLTPTYQGNNLRVEAVASGTGTLFAYDTRAYAGPGAYPLYRSADGGRTWQQLPAIADTSLADTDALAAPDGTLYVTYVSVGAGDSRPAGIYKLAPGASAWHLVSPVVPAQIHAIAIQSDAAGHPAALWGLVFSDRSLGGAWSHPA
ncbi:MAG TPA: sialidase family protein, partial [Ktedonobacterales bacterium]|nr:sialidase family protein [Ktedonobacterales bacterium]